MATPKVSFTSNDLMTIPQAAKELDVHYATVYRWVKKGRLTPFRAGGFMFLLASEVEALKKDNNKCQVG